MGWKEFIASLFGDLAWPLLVVTLALIYKKQLASLLGRLKRGKWGDREIEFTEALERAEKQAEALPAPDSELITNTGDGRLDPASEHTPLAPGGLIPPSEVEANSPSSSHDRGSSSSGRGQPSGAGGGLESPPFNPPGVSGPGTYGKGLTHLAEYAEINPSSAILLAWQLVSHALERLRAHHPGTPPRGQGETALMNWLKANPVIDPALASLITNLRAMRNAVAHGQHTPTAGEAITYVLTTNVAVNGILASLKEGEPSTAADG